jgi:hypothetical protein
MKAGREESREKGNEKWTLSYTLQMKFQNTDNQQYIRESCTPLVGLWNGRN